jgi:hypothetical protein
VNSRDFSRHVQTPNAVPEIVHTAPGAVDEVMQPTATSRHLGADVAVARRRCRALRPGGHRRLVSMPLRPHRDSDRATDGGEPGALSVVLELRRVVPRSISR